MHISPVLHRTVVILEKQDNEAFGFEVQVCFYTDAFFRTGINYIFSNSPLGCVSLCADIWSEGEEQQYGGDVYICVQCAGWQCSRNCRFDCW